MQPHHLTILGLTIDIFGAFFVSVEAIKLENFRALRDRVLRVAHEYTLSPRVIYVDDDEESRPDLVPANRFPGLFMGLHYVAGLLVVFAMNYVFDGLVYNAFGTSVGWVASQPWYLIVLLVLAFIVFGVVLGLWMLGELVHVFLTFSLSTSIKIVDIVEQNTPNGTIGVLGFLLLLVGFTLQIIGTYLGASAIAG